MISKENPMDYYKLLSELGFPMAAALCAGYFVYLTLKFILAGVISNIKSIQNIIHTPEIKTVSGTGDWVESCSALVEHLDGRWELLYNTTIIDKKNQPGLQNQ